MSPEEKQIYGAKATILKALAHPTRLWIVNHLSAGECCVCRLVDQVDADFSTVSKHLAILRQAGIIDSQKRGKQVFYSLKVPCVLEFVNCFEAVIKNNLEEQGRLLTGA